MTTPPFPQPPSPTAVSTPTAVPDASYLAPLPLATPAGAEQARAKASTALGWAIGAAVAAGISVLLSVVAVVLAGNGAFSGADDAYYESVRGQVTALPAGSALSGDRLEWVVDGAERDFGWVVDDIDCPDTPSVARSTVVVCTGTVDGDDWTGVVHFEDSAGSFVLLEL
ncbi:hypothetical protein [Phycicoccus sonneratiae]|uniref:hypothetical protein n=1 Tax=Phycicoccus sonneratiae TaxID=2807628 RepID=UPI001EF3782A|nr:hypothetical protein [Phycicoccus sonneraticus]